MDVAQYFQSVIARKLNRLIGRRGPFWERRYSAESVEGEAAGEWLMEYIFAHGAKEGLVDRGRQWPGVHTIDALLGNRKLDFQWEDWTERYHRARMAQLYRSATRVARADRGGKPALGRRRVMAQNPQSKPRRVNRRRRPLCHASTRAVRNAHRNSYRDFCAAYAVASAEFRRGRLDVEFPLHAFRPPAWLVDTSPPLQRAA